MRKGLAIGLVGLGIFAALALLAIRIDESVSRHQSAWDRDYGRQ